MSTRQKIRAYWRLIFLLPAVVCMIVMVDLWRNRTVASGDSLFAGTALVFLAVHLFRFAIGGALVIADGSKTPLSANVPDVRDRNPSYSDYYFDDSTEMVVENDIPFKGDAPGVGPCERAIRHHGYVSPYLRSRV